VHLPERWIPLLHSCASEAELARVLREYLATIPPKDLAAIPAGADVASFEQAVDMAGIAVILAREELLFRGDDDARAMLNSVSTVFSAAATRLAEIQSQRLRDRLA
jgi:glutaminase